MVAQRLGERAVLGARGQQSVERRRALGRELALEVHGGEALRGVVEQALHVVVASVDQPLRRGHGAVHHPPVVQHHADEQRDDAREAPGEAPEPLGARALAREDPVEHHGLAASQLGEPLRDLGVGAVHGGHVTPGLLGVVALEGREDRLGLADHALERPPRGFELRHELRALRRGHPVEVRAGGAVQGLVLRDHAAQVGALAGHVMVLEDVVAGRVRRRALRRKLRHRRGPRGPDTADVHRLPVAPDEGVTEQHGREHAADVERRERDVDQPAARARHGCWRHEKILPPVCTAPQNGRRRFAMSDMCAVGAHRGAQDRVGTRGGCVGTRGGCVGTQGGCVGTQGGCVGTPKGCVRYADGPCRNGAPRALYAVSASQNAPPRGVFRPRGRWETCCGVDRARGSGRR